MAQVADSAQSAHRLGDQPDPDIFLRPFVPRKGTQRHCDHLEKLRPVQEDPRERMIEYFDVAVFLEAAFSEVTTHGYWEVDGRSSNHPTWATIVRCETFELLVQCPPGKHITLGNLDIVVILQSCLEDASGGAFVRKLTSTSRCWPAGHVDFKWLLRGTMAEGGTSPTVQRHHSLKKLLTPTKRMQQPDQPPEARRASADSTQQTPPSAKRVSDPQPTPSRTKRWKSLRRRSTPAGGGICASEHASPTQEGRRNSLKERASSFFHARRRRSDDSALSASTKSSRDSRGTGGNIMNQDPYSIAFFGI